MIGKLLIISALSIFEAYLSGDMSVWKTVIDTTQWETLCDEDKVLLLNTEYGYVATYLDDAPTGIKHSNKDKEQRQATAKLYLNQFTRHIEDAKSIIPTSRYCMYLSSAYAYDFMMTKNLKSGIKSFQLCKQAVEADSKDPLALTLQGNVEFYSPKILGGSKEKALKLFEEAQQIMLNDEQYKYCWNTPSLLHCIAQCYEKMDRKDDAIKQCQEILEIYPNFSFLKNTYLPSLLVQ